MPHNSVSGVSGGRPQAAEAKLGIALPVGQQGTHKPDNALLRFLLQHRLPARYASDSHVAPGHPLYERIREEVLEAKRRERRRDEAAIFASIDAKLAKIRTRRTAAREEGSATD